MNESYNFACEVWIKLKCAKSALLTLNNAEQAGKIASRARSGK